MSSHSSFSTSNMIYRSAMTRGDISKYSGSYKHIMQSTNRHIHMNTMSKCVEGNCDVRIN